MKTIIGLAGVKTSGKSTVANIIKDFVDAKESTLADKLKNVSAITFGITREQLDSQDLKEVPFTDGPKFFTEEGIKFIFNSFDIGYEQRMLADAVMMLKDTPLETPRKIAQVVGTELLRTYGDSDIHCQNVEILGNTTIISDMRFPNEFEYFDKKNDIQFIPLYIQRDEAESLVTKDSHVSETSVFDFNYKCIKVDNNGTVDETREQVRNILNNLLGND